MVSEWNTVTKLGRHPVFTGTDKDVYSLLMESFKAITGS